MHPATPTSDSRPSQSSRQLSNTVTRPARSSAEAESDSDATCPAAGMPGGSADARPRAEVRLYAAGMIETLSVACKAFAIRSSTVIVGTPPPRSSRDRAD